MLSPLVLPDVKDPKDPNERSIQMLREDSFFSSRNTEYVGGNDDVEWWRVVKVRSFKLYRLGSDLTNFSGPLNEVTLGSAPGGRANEDGKWALPPVCCK